MKRTKFIAGIGLRLNILFLLLFFNSCASKPKFCGNGNLCGLIVDERNRPVCDAVVHCWKNSVCLQTVMTNSNGVFTFFDLPSGAYEISAEKKDYACLDKTSYRFADSDNLFCCQMNTIDFVLECAEKQLICGNIKQMNAILDSLNVSKFDYDKSAVDFYRACGQYVSGDLRSAKKTVKKICSHAEISEDSLLKEIALFQDMINRGGIKNEAL